MATDEAAELMPGGFSRVVAGAAGGLAGGLVFGALMQLTGMIPVVAQLVGQDSAVVGWAVHLGIAGFVGATYALVLGGFAMALSISAVLGVFYGLVWWTLGGLTLLPLRLGIGLFVFDTAAWQGLAGHIGYGLTLGLVYAVVAQLLVRGASGRRAAKHRRRSRAPAEPVPDGPAPAEPGSHRQPLATRMARSSGAGLAPLSPDARALRQRWARE